MPVMTKVLDDKWSNLFCSVYLTMREDHITAHLELILRKIIEKWSIFYF